MFALQGLGHALQQSVFMFWQVLWPLALGFFLSAVIQTLISRRSVASALGSFDPAGVLRATAFGAASSSCSYAAVSIARALVRRGANFANAILFEFASTNLVFELGLVLLVFLGWQFLAAELAGGLVMIAILAVIFKYTLRQRLVDRAEAQAERGLKGRMEGHGAMDMSITEGPLLRRLVSARGFTAVSHYFWMDAYSVWQDVLIGFLIAGALAAWVPDSFWRVFFLTDHPQLGAVWGPLVGPVIAMLSFVCSVGNIPLAAVLWNGGISFGGVISFIFGDLLILPIINIHRKYYTGGASLYLAGVSFVAMASAGFVIGLIFQVLGIVPAHHRVQILTSNPQWDYTTFLDLIALALAALFGVRFLRTGGISMLRDMEMSPDEHAAHGLVTDPVCGMSVDPASSEHHMEFRGRTVHFCSAGCQAAFAADPERYAGAATSGTPPAHPG